MRLRFFLLLIVGFFACHIFISQCWAFFDFVRDYKAHIEMMSDVEQKTPVPWTH